MGTNRVGRRTLDEFLKNCVGKTLRGYVEQGLFLPVLEEFLNDVLKIFLTDSPAKKGRTSSLSLAKAFVRNYGDGAEMSFTGDSICIDTPKAKWHVRHCMGFEVKVTVGKMDGRNLFMEQKFRRVSPLAMIDFERCIPFLIEHYAAYERDMMITAMIYRIEDVTKNGSCKIEPEVR